VDLERPGGASLGVGGLLVVALCVGVATFGHRQRVRAEVEAANRPAGVLPPPPPPSTEPVGPPPLVLDPTAEPTATIEGRVTFDEDGTLRVSDPDGDDDAPPRHAFSAADLDRAVLRYHRDDLVSEYWVDLVDGRRVILDREASRELEGRLPLRFTYGAQRAGDEVQPPP